MLLPGLEEGLEPELYDEVIDILDPDLLDTIAEVDLDSVERNRITVFQQFALSTTGIADSLSVNR